MSSIISNVKKTLFSGSRLLCHRVFWSLETTVVSIARYVRDCTTGVKFQSWMMSSTCVAFRSDWADSFPMALRPMPPEQLQITLKSKLGIRCFKQHPFTIKVCPSSKKNKDSVLCLLYTPLCLHHSRSRLIFLPSERIISPCSSEEMSSSSAEIFWWRDLPGCFLTWFNPDGSTLGQKNKQTENLRRVQQTEGSYNHSHCPHSSTHDQCAVGVFPAYQV